MEQPARGRDVLAEALDRVLVARDLGAQPLDPDLAARRLVARRHELGILAFAANGAAHVDNSGDVSAYSAGILSVSTRAVDAQGQQGVLVETNPAAVD